MKKLSVVIAIVLSIATGLYIARRPSSSRPAPLPSAQQSSTHQATQNDDPKGFNSHAYSLDDVTSIWVVVNKQRPLSPKDYAPSDLIAVGGGQYLRSEAASALTELIAAAQTTGLKLNPLSGYRSYQTQVTVYGNEVKAYGQAVADSESARPGTSEHQTGLAIDVGGGGCGIEDCFGNTDEGKWLAGNAYRYGFIIRYPEGKQAVTGYRYEPWHIRYVGTALATEMQKQGVLTLEEFFGLPAAPNY